MIICVYLFEQPPATIDPRTWFMAYYGAVVTFNSVVWLARISLVFTAVRIAAFRHQKMCFIAVAILFGIIYIVLVAQIFWLCEPQPDWKTADPPQCDLGLQRSITEICTDVCADIFLLMLPIYIFMRTRLERPTRIRLLLLFSTCALLTVVSVVQDVLILVAGGTREVFASMFEDAFALIVCNIPVVGTALINLVERKRAGATSHSGLSAMSDSPHSSGFAPKRRRANHQGRQAGQGISVEHEVTFGGDSYEMEGTGKTTMDRNTSRTTLSSDLEASKASGRVHL